MVQWGHALLMNSLKFLTPVRSGLTVPQHAVQGGNELSDIRMQVGFCVGLFLAFCKEFLGDAQRYDDRARYVRLLGMIPLELPDFRIDVSGNAAYALLVLLLYLQGIVSVKNADADGPGHDRYRLCGIR